MPRLTLNNDDYAAVTNKTIDFIAAQVKELLPDAPEREIFQECVFVAMAVYESMKSVAKGE